MWLAKFNFKTRLIFGFGILIVINFILVLISIKDLEKSNENLTKLYKHPFVVSNAVRKIDRNIIAIHRSMKDVALSQNTLELNKALKRINGYDKTVKDNFKTVLNLFLGDLSTVKKSQKAYLNWQPIRQNVINLLKQGKKEEAYKITKTIGDDYVTSLLNKTRDMIDFAKFKSTELYDKNLRETKTAKDRLVILLILSFVLSFVITTIISRSITLPLSKLSQRIQKNFEFSTNEKLKFKTEQEMLEYSVTNLEKMTREVTYFNKQLETEVAIKSKDLFEKNQFFEKMIAKSPLAFIYFDTENKVIMWSPAAETIFGYTTKEALGKNIVDLIVSSDNKKGINELIEPVFAASVKQIQQSENITKSGKHIICNWYNTAIKDENNKVIGLSSLVEDITKRIKVAADLKETNQSLQDMVYIASHDLQVPLVSMEGYATEVLQDYKDNLDEEGVYCLTRLQSNVQRMHKLVLSLLDISRLNTHINQYEKFDLNKVLDNITKDLSLTLEKNKVSINYKKLPTIYADKQRIEIVLRNLVTNAINYEGKKIDITFRKGVLAVADNGIGIPSNQLKKIFLPGERLKMNKASGVGMGLAFCDKVIKKHQGTIWAESKGLNKGTTINIKFNKTTLNV